MEVVFIEDPCCSWCWAYQPVRTAFAFEYQGYVRSRCIMGGLRDYPIADVDFVVGQWRMAAQMSGMTFDTGIWKKRVLRTTYVACRAVKAVGLVRPGLADRFLRRLREAFFTEQRAIDDLERILPLAEEVGVDVDRFGDHISSGRAEALFQRDLSEASRHGFGYPTTLVRNPHADHPIVLEGVIPYSDLTRAIADMGFPAKRRRKFRDRPRDWQRLFQLRPRLSLPELTLVTELRRDDLKKRLSQLGARQIGPFYCLDTAKDTAPGKKEKGTNGDSHLFFSEGFQTVTKLQHVTGNSKDK